MEGRKTFPANSMSNYIFEEEYFEGTMFTSLSDWWDDIPLLPDRPLTPAASS